jgi:hypothetical protein
MSKSEKEEVPWQIIKELSFRKSTFEELSSRLNLSKKDILDNLKYLQVRKYIKKEGNQYIINGDYAYLILITNGFAEKKIIMLDEYRKNLINDWLNMAEKETYGINGNLILLPGMG